MKINLQIRDTDRENFIENYECDNPLKLIEMAISLFKESGGEVGYKDPNPGEGDRFFSSRPDAGIVTATTWPIGDPTHTRLTFTPPKPKPVESEYEKLQEWVRVNTINFSGVTQQMIETIMDKINELDRRCPVGGGK